MTNMQQLMQADDGTGRPHHGSTENIGRDESQLDRILNLFAPQSCQTLPGCPSGAFTMLPFGGVYDTGLFRFEGSTGGIRLSTLTPAAQ